MANTPVKAYKTHFLGHLYKYRHHQLNIALDVPDRLGEILYRVQHLLVNGAVGLVKSFQHSPVEADRWKVTMDRPVCPALGPDTS